MNARIRDIFKVSFWTWLVIAIICVVLMVLAPVKAETFAAFIMATFMLLPMRDWTYRLLVWGIDYVSSVNTNIKDKINPHATYNRLLDPSKRFQNDGFYRILRTVILVITLILALLWMVFQGVAFNVVYAWLHTFELLFTGKIGWTRLLFLVLLLVVFIRFFIWGIGVLLKAEMWSSYEDADGEIQFYFDFSKALWRIPTMLIGIYAIILVKNILLRYSFGMTLSSFLFWTVVLVLPYTVIFVVDSTKRKSH